MLDRALRLECRVHSQTGVVLQFCCDERAFPDGPEQSRMHSAKQDTPALWSSMRVGMRVQPLRATKRRTSAATCCSSGATMLSVPVPACPLLTCPALTWPAPTCLAGVPEHSAAHRAF
jgi:hypothetical protein